MDDEEQNQAQRMIATVERLHRVLESAATGGDKADEPFKALRLEVLRYPGIAAEAPEFLATCRNMSAFWSFIQRKFAHYVERRDYLNEVFAPTYAVLEASHQKKVALGPVMQAVPVAAQSIREDWAKARQRAACDPSGAITSARALIESTCKIILDEAKEPYEDGFDLPKLYRLTSKKLNMAAEDHVEASLRMILSGCFSVVQGLGALRNKVGDAHGAGERPRNPGRRHAELAVNLAGSMSKYLLDTWEYRKSLQTS